MPTGTTRLLLSNLAVKTSATSTYPRLRNTPSALVNYPATNVLNPDRTVVWAVGSVVGDHVLDFDLGAAKSVNLLGVHGWTVNYVMPSQMQVFAGAVYPFDSSWVYAGAESYGLAGRRDALWMLSETLSYRYWRFQFNLNISGFQLGKCVLGMASDLGIAFSPGSTDTLVRPRVSTPMVDGIQTKTVTGLNYRRLGMQFLRVPQSIRDTLMSAAERGPVSLLDPYGRAFEIDLDELTATAIWGDPDLYDVAFEVQSLP